MVIYPVKESCIAMEKNKQVFVARQAIFNRKSRIVGYELLYRDGISNEFPRGIEPHIATTRVINNSHFHLGIERLTDRLPALINLSEECIRKGIAHLLPKDNVILEVLETVTPSDEIYHALHELFHKGYRIALDDFVLKAEWIRFLNLVKIIKVDMQSTSELEVRQLVNKLSTRPNIRFLAEKVETVEEVEFATELGFKFFQGYYFSKPEVKRSHSSDPLQHILLLVINEVMRDDIRLRQLEQYFSKDARLIFKLLRYLNGGQFPVKVEISSIAAALRYLGTVALRRFITLLATSMIGVDHSEHLVKQSILYASFCERLAKAKGVDHEQAFLVGLLSVLPAMLGVTIAQLIAVIAVEKSIAEGLKDYHVDFGAVGKTLNHIRQLAVLYDQGKWYQSQKLINVLGLSIDEMPEYYQQSVRWSEEFMQRNISEKGTEEQAINITLSHHRSGT